MTVAPDVTPLAFDDIDDAIAALRERGLRLSASRRIVLQALFDAPGPISAEHLARQFSLDLTSVYRNLETLERHGLIRHVHLGHGAGLYTLLGRGEVEYLYCERCEAVSAVAPAQLDPVRAQIREHFGYQARFTHFPIVGTCTACAAGQAAPSTSAHAHHHHHHHH